MVIIAELWGRVGKDWNSDEGKGPNSLSFFTAFKRPHWDSSSKTRCPFGESCISSTLTCERSGVWTFVLGLVLLHYEVKLLNFGQTISPFLPPGM